MVAATTRIVPFRDWQLLIGAACVLLAAGCTGSGGEKEAAAQKPPSTVAIPETTRKARTRHMLGLTDPEPGG